MAVRKRDLELAKAVIVAVIKNASTVFKTKESSGAESVLNSVTNLQILAEEKVSEQEEEGLMNTDSDYAKEILGLINGVKKDMEEQPIDIEQLGVILPENQFHIVATEIVALMTRYKLLRTEEDFFREENGGATSAS